MSSFKHREATYVYSFPKANKSKQPKTIKIKGKEITINNKDEILPGPGSFNPNKVSLLKFPAYRIGNQKRFLTPQNNKSPGVGDYNLSSLIGRETPKISFAKKLNIKNFASTNPAPGHYDPNFKIVKPSDPKYKIRPFTSLDPQRQSKMKKKSDSNIKNLGPGEYLKVKEFYDKTKGFSFSKETKFRKMKLTYENTPGYYNTPHIADSMSIKVGINGPHQSKSKVEIKRDVPGPGTYFTKETVNPNEKYSIGIRRPYSSIDKNKIKFPSPGSYFESIRFQATNVKIAFPKANRKGLEIQSNLNNPSLEKYDPNFSLVREKHSAFSFGSSQRSNFSGNNNPGIGQYSIEGKLGNFGPKYSINKEHQTKARVNNKVENPGPQQYDNTKINILYKASSWKFDQSVKLNNSKISESQPGPGQYDPSLIGSKKGIFIGTSNRKNLKTTEVPGPGHYHIPYSLFDFPGFVPISGFDAKFKFI